MKSIILLSRYLIIISKLQKEKEHYVNAAELLAFVNKEIRLRGEAGISLRTLERDIQDIEELGFHIDYKRNYGYRIENRYPNALGNTEQMLLNFDLLNAMNSDSIGRQYILPEHHRPMRSEQIPQLIDAIRNNFIVEFNYINFRQGDEVKHVKAEPHFLKESNQRWYLLAKESGILKTYAIDRIYRIETLENEKFERDKSIDIDGLFRDCFGIWRQEEIPVEDIELSYSSLDGKFIKTLPLHHSQRIIRDTDEEFRIALRLRITNDFVMELLSRSSSLTVIRPQHLRERVYKIFEEAAKRNS